MVAHRRFLEGDACMELSRLTSLVRRTGAESVISGQMNKPQDARLLAQSEAIGGLL